MIYHNTRLLAFLAMVMTVSSMDKFCHRGQYVYQPSIGPAVCIVCPEGTFMPLQGHAMNKCYDSAEMTNPGEKVIQACNSTHDSVMICATPDHYWTRPNYEKAGVCKKCSDCSGWYVIQKCSNTSDTACCPTKHYRVIIQENGQTTCQSAPVMCDQGERVDKTFRNCRPCLQGSFMDETRHQHENCKDCRKCSDGEIEVNKCNRTHDAICQPKTTVHPEGKSSEAAISTSPDAKPHGNDSQHSPSRGASPTDAAPHVLLELVLPLLLSFCHFGS